MTRAPNILGIAGIPVREYAVVANAVLGIRDSGKTYTATKAAEELFDASIPFLALDPIGVWHTLRIPGAGRGYPVVVAGGKHGDLPLTVKSVGEIVRAAMKANISLVLDLFSADLSKADWKRIVRETAEILLHENADHGLRHVFIEEAAEFVPQIMRGADGQVFAAVEKLVRMGGNSKVGVTLINQRSADLNKSVLELCANVFVHRQRGKNTLLDLKKWLALTDPSTEKKITGSLPDLPSGQCWVMGNDLKTPMLVKVMKKNSRHPDRREAPPANEAERKRRQPVPADDFVAAMKAALAPKEKPATGKAVPITPVPPHPSTYLATKAELEQVRKDAFAAGWSDGWATGWRIGHAKGCRDQVALFDNVAQANTPDPAPPAPKPPTAPKVPQGTLAPPPVPRSIPNSVVVRHIPAASGNPGAALPKAEKAILKVLVHFPDGAEASKVATLAGYSAGGGGFRNACGALRTAGLLEPGQPLRATQAGVEAAGDVEPLPTGQALLAYWCGHSALGKAEREILTALVHALPSGLTKEEVAAQAGYEPGGGGFRNALGRLRTLDLITGSGSAPLRAAEEFA